MPEKERIAGVYPIEGGYLAVIAERGEKERYLAAERVSSF